MRRRVFRRIAMVGFCASAVLAAAAGLVSAEMRATTFGDATGALGTQTSAPRPRALFSLEDQQSALVLGIDHARFWGDSDRDFLRIVRHAHGPWLALSAGGADRPFGAGVLAGWTELGTRPAFDVVSGVSAGALMAPFAFLGPRYDAQLATGAIVGPGLEPLPPGNSGEALLDARSLRARIDADITAGLLREIAAEHARGRRLLVVTTSLDAGRPVVWNMGAIATHGDDAALQLFRDVLLASVSSPGLHPPVRIVVSANGRRIQELHADGALSQPLFVAPPALLEAARKDRLPAGELYVVINADLAADFVMPELDTAALLQRSIDVGLRTALRSQLAKLRTAASRQHTTLHIATIGADFQRTVKERSGPAAAQALLDYGRARGRSGHGFETHTNATAGWQSFIRKLTGPVVAR